MNPLSWLLAALRRQPTVSVLTPSPTPTPSAPTSASAPPTEAERAERRQRRLLAHDLALADDFHQAVKEGRDITDELPADLLRLICLLQHNQADQQLARQHGQWAEELRLVTEAQEMEAVAKHQLWQHALCMSFGHTNGTKLSQHEIEPGMKLEMVAAVLGAPAEGNMTVPLDDPATCVLRYGSDTVIELRHGVVVRAQLGTIAFPAYVYELPSITGADGPMQPAA